MPPARHFRRALLAALLLAPFSAARADDQPPDSVSIDVTDCDGNFQSNSTVTSTGTPTIRWLVRDTGTGLNLGTNIHVGSTSAQSVAVLLLHFDQDLISNNVVIDSTTIVNTVNTSGVNSPALVASMPNFGNARSWDGALNEYVHIKSSPTLSSTTDQFTIQAWINPADITSRPIFEYNNVAGSSIGVQLWMGKPSNTGELFANVVDTTNVSHSLTSPKNVIQANQWQLVTFTWSLGSGITLYVDSVTVAAGAINLHGLFPLTQEDAWIGTDRGSGTSFKGLMDEVRVLRQLETPNSVSADYYSGLFEFSTTTQSGNFVGSYLNDLNFTHPPAVSTGITTLSTVTVANVPLISGSNNYVRFTIQDLAGNTLQTGIPLTVQTGPPFAPPNFTGTPLSTGSAQWTWSQPTRACFQVVPGTYNFYNGATGALIASTGNPVYFESNLSTNTLYVRQVSAMSLFGAGPLTPATSFYTDAAPAVALQSTFSITTTQLGISWSSQGNPLYTRWEVSFSSDPKFGINVSTPIAIFNNFTGTSTVLTGLTASTTYYVRVRAQNGRVNDGFVYVSSLTAFTVGAFPTQPRGITLSTGPSTTSSVTWIWSPLDQTATGYTLISSTGGVLFYAPPNVNTYTLPGLGPNVSVTAQVITNSLGGNSNVSNAIGAYTLAFPPTSAALTGVSTDTVSLNWNVNTDPPYTVFQVVLATSSDFSLQQTTYNTTGNSLTATGLLPGSTYFLHVRALNGDGIPSTFNPAAPLMAVTNSLSPFSSAPIPPSPYALGAQTVATWHFDESSGTFTADASGNGNNGTLTCFALNCSTPTFVPSFTGMGNAVSYPGVQDTLCQVPHVNASMDGPGSVTVEAWVNPSASPQTVGAGVLAKGAVGDAGFYALDIAGSQWRFLVNDYLHTVVSTQSIVVGQWTHVAGVYDEPGQTLRIYVNGVLSQTQFLAATARPGNGQETSIGSRRSGPFGPPTHYDLPFAGEIDEVHVSSRALSGGEVANDFNSARLAQVSLSQGVCLLLQPNTFPGSGSIIVSSDPVHFPLEINPSILLQGLATPPTGQTLVPNSVTEVVASIGGIPFTGLLGSPATLCLPYPDPFGTGLVVGTSPPVVANKLLMYTFNPTTVSWTPLPSSVDLNNKQVFAQTPHFSIFALFGPSGIKPDTNSVRIYPVPWQPGSGGRFDSATIGTHTGLVFDNLPGAGTIKIFTLSGQMAVELGFGPNDQGTVVWNGKNLGGRDVASGVYFAYIKSSDGSSTAVKKLAIER